MKNTLKRATSTLLALVILIGALGLTSCGAPKLEEVKDEEQEALDNMPYSLQESERGQQMQEYIDTMDSVLSDLDLIDTEDLSSQLEEITEG